MEEIQSIIIEIIKAKGANIIWIAILFFIGRAALKKIVKHAVRLTDVVSRENSESLEKRAKTLGGILVTTGNIVIYIVILLMVLDLFGVDITPILAGAGIIGLAIGFGAQSLVKDFVSGIFILIENQYGIGDRVKIGSAEGKVIKITMRSTVLRDDNGGIFYLSNGYVTSKEVANISQISGEQE